jgi:hypothetical protein
MTFSVNFYISMNVVSLIIICSVSRLSRKMWEPQRLITMWASMAYYRDSFAFTYSNI